MAKKRKVTKFDVWFNKEDNSQWPYHKPNIANLSEYCYPMPNCLFETEIEYDDYHGNGWFTMRSTVDGKLFQVHATCMDRIFKSGGFNGNKIRSTFYFTVLGGLRVSLNLA